MKPIRVWVGILAVLAAVQLCDWNSSAAASDVVLIANNGVPRTEIGADTIEQIFLGRKTRWSDGGKISFVILDGGETHEAFLKTYINKTESQYTIFWKKMVFTGKGRFPTAFQTPREVRAYVAVTPGAIGYVPPEIADSSVKTLNVSFP